MFESWRDVRFALRLLTRTPVLTLTVTLLLGIGIGANTLIFSVLDALLLRSLPVTHPERVLRLIEVHPTGFVTWDLPYALYDHLANHSTSLTDVLCQGDLDVAFQEGVSTERIRINAVSPNFFQALGIRPLVGRALALEDDKPGLLHAVLSYDFWQKRLGGSRSILGHTVRLNGRDFTVVGILPSGMNGLNVDTSPALRVPLSAVQLLFPADRRDPFASLQLQFQIFGWLRAGLSLPQAEAAVEPELKRVFEDTLASAYSELGRPRVQPVVDSRLRLEPAGNGISSLRTQFSSGLKLLMTGAGLLLLMACGNVAGLLLVRSAARSEEIRIRLILGATRARIARQLLTDSVTLAALGGFLGVLLTYACRPLLLAALPPIRDRAAVLQPLAAHLDINLRVLSFAVITSLLTGLVFGLLPAFRGARKAPTESLSGSRTTTARQLGRSILVAAQVALCVLLLAGAAVLIETFDQMRAMSTGFDRDHIVTFTLDTGMKGYKTDRTKILGQQLLEKTRSLPGVIAAGLASRGVMRGTGIKATYEPAGQPISRDDFLNSSLNSVTPGYFDAMGIRVLAGRDFTWFDDNKPKPCKAIVNQTFVERFFPRQNALGQRFGGRGSDGLAKADCAIIGIVSDAKYRSLREPIPPTVYGPMMSDFSSEFILHLRTRIQPASFIAPVREILRSLDPELPFVEVSTLREDVQMSLWQERLLAWLSSIFACFAALLAALGIYGVLDFAVTSRTREVGVRVALGANPLRVVQMLSSETMLFVLTGAVCGISAYFVSVRWIRQVIYGISPTDPKALEYSLVFVLFVALIAAVPAVWRAVRIDPATALRHE